MGIISSNKTVDREQIACDGSLQVTLSLTAAPDILTSPTDMVLVLDRSGSMAGEPLAAVKEGSKTFIEIIAEATDGDSENIGSGSRIGIVSFSNVATQNTGLITSVAALENAIDSIQARSGTNHADAFQKAMELFDPTSASAKVMIMFTDGRTTVGPNPSPVAAAARAMGIEIYCIGLVGDDGIDVPTLNDWASDPDATHVAVTPDAEALNELFAELAANITKPGATNIVISEMVQPDFAIEEIEPPVFGSVAQMGSTSLQWRIPKLGETEAETAQLTFRIRHTNETEGIKEVNRSITYSDTEGNLVTFPNPKVLVSCDVVVTPDPCPVAVPFTVGGCEDAVVVDLGTTGLSGNGRIIEASVTLQGVCPGREVAFAAILKELLSDGGEVIRGLKTYTIPAVDGTQCKDIKVSCIRFVVPEEGEASCEAKTFSMEFIAHYSSSDYVCCEQELPIQP